MQGKYKVITLCGSTRFKKEFLEMQKRLTLQGNIVISVGLFGHSGDDEALEVWTKKMLDDMHKSKIDMADEIFVIDVNDYIGESTKSEIEYAKACGKVIRFYSHEYENPGWGEHPEGEFDPPYIYSEPSSPDISEWDMEPPLEYTED